MKAHLKKYKLIGLLSLIIQIVLYVISLYVLLMPTPLSKYVNTTYENMYNGTSSVLFAKSIFRNEMRSASPTGEPTVIIDPSNLTAQAEEFKKRRATAAPGETLESIALSVYGLYFKRKQSVGIWGDSLYGHHLISYDVNFILDSKPNGFEVLKVWQPYALRPLYLLLDYLTVLASLFLLRFTLFLLKFTFTQVRAHFRKKSRLCTKCAYPLLKTATDTTCPECGQLNPALSPDTPI